MTNMLLILTHMYKKRDCQPELQTIKHRDYGKTTKLTYEMMSI